MRSVSVQELADYKKALSELQQQATRVIQELGVIERYITPAAPHWEAPTMILTPGLNPENVHAVLQELSKLETMLKATTSINMNMQAKVKAHARDLEAMRSGKRSLLRRLWPW
jgi:uncharacterized coiled-coil DUF342 family protein